MSDLLTDCAVRIARADAKQLREIYKREIQAPIWTDEERETLLQAFGTRAAYWNRIEIGLTEPRWALKKGVV